ncbi:MAG TPA: AEC family transporter [Sphaerochaeta sp.]|nr:AEC family transporter [Sphaerochaeta sp.]
MVFLTAFSVLFPLFAKIGLGWGVRQLGIIGEETIDELNNVVFRILLPVLLFINIYQSDFTSITNFDFLLFSVLALMGFFFITLAIVPHFSSEDSRRGVMVQGIARSNFIFFGLPMAQSLFGGTSLGLSSILVGVLTPVLNLISILSLEYFRGGKADKKKLVKSVVGNPVLIGGMLGVLMLVFHIPLPQLIVDFLVSVGDLATPLALMLLGSSVKMTSMKKNRRALIAGTLSRLIIMPAAGIALSVALGFRGLELILLMSLFASPTSVNSYTMAQQMDGDTELAVQLVVITTVLSLFTLLGWISLLMRLGYF